MKRLFCLLALGLSVSVAHAQTRSVQVAVLQAWKPGSKGLQRGCDEVVKIRVPQKTVTPDSALRALFGLDNRKLGTAFSFIDRSNDAIVNPSRQPVQFDRVTVSRGVAQVYLKGDPPVYAGVCDDIRLTVQIEETLRQFSTVKSVSIYLNKKPYTPPNESGQ